MRFLRHLDPLVIRLSVLLLDPRQIRQAGQRSLAEGARTAGVSESCRAIVLRGPIP